MTHRIPRPKAVLFDLFHTLVSVAPKGKRIPPTWEDLGLSRDAYEKRWFDDRDGRATGRIKDPVEVSSVRGTTFPSTFSRGLMVRLAVTSVRMPSRNCACLLTEIVSPRDPLFVAMAPWSSPSCAKMNG